MDNQGVKKMCQELVGYCREYPGIKVFVIAGYDYWFGEFFLPALFEVVGQDSHECELDRNGQRLSFGNGSILRFRAYDDPAMIKGWEAHVIWFVQESFQGENKDKVREIWNHCYMRIRAKRPLYPTRWIVSHEEKEG